MSAAVLSTMFPLVNLISGDPPDFAPLTNPVGPVTRNTPDVEFEQAEKAQWFPNYDNATSMLFDLKWRDSDKKLLKVVKSMAGPFPCFGLSDPPREAPEYFDGTKTKCIFSDILTHLPPVQPTLQLSQPALQSENANDELWPASGILTAANRDALGVTLAFRGWPWSITREVVKRDSDGGVPKFYILDPSNEKLSLRAAMSSRGLSQDEMTDLIYAVAFRLRPVPMTSTIPISRPITPPRNDSGEPQPAPPGVSLNWVSFTTTSSIPSYAVQANANGTLFVAGQVSESLPTQEAIAGVVSSPAGPDFEITPSSTTTFGLLIPTPSNLSNAVQWTSFTAGDLNMSPLNTNQPIPLLISGQTFPNSNVIARIAGDNPTVITSSSTLAQDCDVLCYGSAWFS